MFDKFAHAAFGVLCLVATARLASDWYRGESFRTSAAANGLPARSAPALSSRDLSGVEGLPTQGPVLVVAIRDGCRYCTASMDFYKRLVSAASGSSTPIFFLAPHATEVTRAYLSRHGVVAPKVLEVNLDAIGVPGTPTIALLDASKRVERSWIGQLRGADQERAVLDALQAGTE